MAFLSAAGVQYTPKSPSPRGSLSPGSPAGAAALLELDQPSPVSRLPRKRGADPNWLQQPLPKKLAVYKDMFGA